MQRHTLARCMAFYVPAFYPFPENDRWWGPGFTEWMLVQGARPLFAGHRQPRIPDPLLGYYDPRETEVRKRQACLAVEHGIEAFCYWHNWFAGKTLLHETVEDVLKTGVPEMPYCLAWANQTWTRTWARSRTLGEVLIEQTYPGTKDHRSHFEYLLPFFHDDRYVRVEGKPLFVIYRPSDIPDAGGAVELWQSLARKAGLPGIFFVGMARGRRPALDGYTRKQPPEQFLQYGMGTVRKGVRGDLRPILQCVRSILGRPQVFSQNDFVLYAGHRRLQEQEFPQVLANWDDTPRQGRRGTVIAGAGSDLLRENLAHAVRSLQSRPFERRLLFLKSWNEWGEGNYVEPDNVHGLSSLQTIRDILVT
jgi:hypothetical protein